MVAGDEEIAHLDLADEEHVYRVGNFRSATDLVNVLIAGSASAGQAMAECSSLRTNVAPCQPSAIASEEEVVFGVFTCTCNGTLTTPAALERIRDMAARMPA